MHGYIPRSFYRRNTGKPSKAQANPEPETSINFSVKLASPFLFNESASSSPVVTSNLLPLNESFSNCLYPFPYDYTWDAPSQPELLATQSEMMEQIEFHQDQKENCQPPDNFFAPQFPDRKQTFPGYKTTGQLYGSYGLDLNPVFDPSPEPAGLAMFTNATNARLHQVPSVSDFNDLVNLQTYSSPDSTNLYASSIGHSQLTDFNGEMLNSVDLYLSNSQLSASDYQIPSFVNLSAPNLDYFDQFWLDLVFNLTFGTIPLGCGMENGLMAYSWISISYIPSSLSSIFFRYTSTSLNIGLFLSQSSYTLSSTHTSTTQYFVSFIRSCYQLSFFPSSSINTA